MRGILTRTAHTHGTRENLCIFTVTPDPLRGIRMKRIKRMKLKKGATFLAERYYLSRSLQPPFSGNIHQICYPIGRILIVTQITQIFFRPPDSFLRQLLQLLQHLMATLSPKSTLLTKKFLPCIHVIKFSIPHFFRSKPLYLKGFW
jgi:hypothetical protein